MRNPTGIEVMATEWTLLTIGVAMVTARLYLRLGIQRLGLQITDAFLCTSLFLCLTCGVLDVIMFNGGALQPNISLAMTNLNVDPVTLDMLKKVNYMKNYPFHISFYCTKLALLTFYLTLFPPFLVKLRATVWVTIVGCVCALITTVSLSIFLCFPVERNWTSNAANRCSSVQQVNTFYVNVAFHLSGELIIFILPFLMLRHVRLRSETRVGVYATFAVGIATISMGVTRTVLTITGSADPSVKNSGKSITQILLYSALDTHMGLIVATMPLLRPYLGIVSRKLASCKCRSADSSSNGGGGGGERKARSIGDTTYENFDPHGHLDAPLPPPPPSHPPLPPPAALMDKSTAADSWDDWGNTRVTTAVSQRGQGSDIELVHAK